MSLECDSKTWGKIECQCLKTHNQYRQQHGAPSLKLSKHLNKTATAWAKKLASKGEMQHSSDTIYGENLFFCSGFANVTGDMAVKAWYDEIVNYDFTQAEFTPGSGHFSQVVWKNSAELGVGYARKGNNFYLVCNYLPAGNVRGMFRENVLPKISAT